MKLKLLLMAFVFVLFSVGYANAEQCITIEGESYCCSNIDDNVCPEDYENAFDVRVDCSSNPDADCPAPVYQCNDGLDNDGDTCIDLGDNDCLSATDNSESGTDCGINTCQLTDAYWSGPDLSYPGNPYTVGVGMDVYLVVKGDSNCADGETVSFSFSGGTASDATFNNGLAVGHWVTDNDGVIGEFTAETDAGRDADSRNILTVEDENIELKFIDISPSSVNLHTPGGAVQYRVWAYYYNEDDKDYLIYDVTSNPYTFYASLDPMKVIITQTGFASATCVSECSGDMVNIYAYYPYGGSNQKNDFSIVTLTIGSTEYVELRPVDGFVLDIGDDGDFDLWYYKDGIGTEVTSGASYDSSDTSVAIVDSSTGEVDAQKGGSTTVTGEYSGLSDTAPVVVNGESGGGAVSCIDTNCKGVVCDTSGGWSCQGVSPDCQCLRSAPGGGYISCEECQTNGVKNCYRWDNNHAKIFGSDYTVSCTPIGENVPFFGWVHVFITISLLTGYYIIKSKKD